MKTTSTPHEAAFLSARRRLLLTAPRAVVGLALIALGCSGTAGSTPVVEGVTVSPASEVRQGQTGVTISVGHAAGGLSQPSRVDLEDLQVAIDPRSTDDHLLLDVTVPHGTKPGPRTLTFDTPSGTITTEAALDVTFITVSTDGADSELGTTNAPFRSLKQALAVAGSGDTCVLGAGTFDQSGGETWSYTAAENLTIAGSATAATVLQGPAPIASTATNAALAPTTALTLQNLTLADFGVAVDVATPAQLSLQDVAITGNGKGVLAEGAGSTVKLTNDSLATGDSAVQMAETCTGCSLSIDGTALTESGQAPLILVPAAAVGSQLALTNAQLSGGIFVDDPQSTLSVDSSHITGSGSFAPINFGGAKLDLSGSTLTAGSAPYGINLRGATMTMTRMTVEGNQYSVYQLAGHSKVRDTKLTGYMSIGFYFASGDLDLGSATEAGNNTFVDKGTDAYALYVDTNTSPLSCSDTSFDGVVPPTGVVQAGDDLLTQPTEYVLTAGKTISFYDVPAAP